MAWSYWQNEGDRISSVGGGPVVLPTGTPTQYLVDGAIAHPGTAVLTKGSAGAYTLSAPLSDNETLIATNATAFAHVITATGLIQDGVTGGAKNTATFGAFVGSSLELKSFAGKWNVINKNVVTIA